MTVSNSNFSDCAAQGVSAYGGAMALLLTAPDTDVQLSQVTVKDCFASASAQEAQGGGVLVLATAVRAYLAIAVSGFANCSAVGLRATGGAAALTMLSDSTIVLDTSRFRDGRVQASGGFAAGGAVRVQFAGILMVLGSVFERNLIVASSTQAVCETFGGALIVIFASVVNFRDSSFVYNALAHRFCGIGGAVLLQAATPFTSVTLANVNFTANSVLADDVTYGADSSGGALEMRGNLATRWDLVAFRDNLVTGFGNLGAIKVGASACRIDTGGGTHHLHRLTLIDNIVFAETTAGGLPIDLRGAFVFVGSPQLVQLTDSVFLSNQAGASTPNGLVGYRGPALICRGTSPRSEFRMINCSFRRHDGVLEGVPSYATGVATFQTWRRVLIVNTTFRRNTLYIEGGQAVNAQGGGLVTHRTSVCLKAPRIVHSRFSVWTMEKSVILCSRTNNFWPMWTTARLMLSAPLFTSHP